MNPVATTSPPLPNSPLLTIMWDQTAWALSVSINYWLFIAALLITTLILAWRWYHGSFAFSTFEIDQAEVGIGNGKIRFKPNQADKQIAYAIWVELSTRKIGLPIDLEHDVIADIYDSWYSFFSVTRELIKTVPVAKVRRDSTQKVIRLSISILNEGLRPHLTIWQARFRIWYERELKRSETDSHETAIDLQELQKMFPKYGELTSDLQLVNQRLIHYRGKMREIVMKD